MEAIFNLIINYAILICSILLLLVYVGSLIINIIRSQSLKKEIKSGNILKVTGKVTNIVPNKKKLYVQVLYTSPVNKLLYEAFFEYFQDDWKDRAKLGDEIEIIYPNVENEKRVYNFPIFLTGDKIKMPLGGLVTDLLLVAFGGYAFGTILTLLINNNGFTVGSSLNDVFGNSIILLVIYAVMHLLLFSYVIQRFSGASPAENEHYLQLYGVNATAEVKTFKFVGQKNQKGVKESQMDIEYFDESGNTIKTRCSSYYYSETQEQYINILYDKKNKKNVVYIKQPDKKRKEKVNF